MQGIVPAVLNGSRTERVGVYSTDYGQMALQLPHERLDAYAATGGAHAVTAGRISYFFGTARAEHGDRCGLLGFAGGGA